MEDYMRCCRYCRYFSTYDGSCHLPMFSVVCSVELEDIAEENYYEIQNTDFTVCIEQPESFCCNRFE